MRKGGRKEGKGDRCFGHIYMRITHQNMDKFALKSKKIFHFFIIEIFVFFPLLSLVYYIIHSLIIICLFLFFPFPLSCIQLSV